MKPEGAARILVLGTGYGLSVHAPALLESALVASVSVAGRSATDGRLPPGVLAVSDWRDEVARGAFDAAVVAVPPAAQQGIARDLISARLPVLLEKPGGLLPGDLRALATMAGPVPVALGYGFRFARGLTRMLDLVRTGGIGDVRHVAVSWLTSGWSAASRPWSWRCDQAAGGGVLRDVAAHSLDYMRLIHPAPIRAVAGLSGRSHTTRRTATGEDLAVTAPDMIDVALCCEDGVTMRLTVGNAMPTAVGHAVEVVGTAGHARWHHPAPFASGGEVVHVTTGGDTRSLDIAADAPSHDDARIAATRRMVDAFIAPAEGIGPATLDDGARVLELIERIEASLVPCP